MLIDNHNKFIVLQIPKCASGTMVAVFPETTKLTSTPIHGTVTDLCTNKQLIHSEYKLVAFVRNPWDRLLSIFSWETRNEKQPQSFKNWLLNHSTPGRTHGRTPNTYPEQTLQRRQQISWLVNDSGEFRVDCVGKVETLTKDIKKIRQHLNLKQIQYDGTRYHETKHVPYQEIYDNEMIEFVEHHHSIDIKHFNYSFGD